MLKKLATPVLVGAAAAAALVPLYGNPRTAPVTHAEWARLLLRGLELEDALPPGAAVSLAFSALSWKSSLAQPAEHYQSADGVELLAPDSAGQRQLRALADQAEASYALAVARGGDYRVRLRATGQAGASARVELLRLAETQPTESYTVRLPTAPGWVEAGIGHLDPGAWTARLQLPVGAALEMIEVAPPCLSPIEPLGGWVTATLTSNVDLAVTLLRASDLERELPSVDEPVEIPAGRFRSLDASAENTGAGSSSLDAFRLQAGPNGLQALVSVDVPEAGLYTVSAFGLRGQGQSWSADGCRKAIVCGAREAESQPLWQPLTTAEFSPGHHVFTVTLGPGATIERLKLERKRQGGEDYVATLRRLGFDPGPDGPITRPKAYDAMDWLKRQRDQARLTQDCPTLWERPTVRTADSTAGPGTEPGGPSVVPPILPPTIVPPITPPITPPVVPPQPPGSPDTP